MSLLGYISLAGKIYKAGAPFELRPLRLILLSQTTVKNSKITGLIDYDWHRDDETLDYHLEGNGGTLTTQDMSLIYVDSDQWEKDALPCTHPKAMMPCSSLP